MRRLLKIFAVISLVASSAGAVQAADKTLNLFIWSDYLGPHTLSDFTTAMGIDVHVDVYDSSEMLEAKMLVPGSGYDVIVPNGPALSRLIKAGVLRALDKTKLPNISTQDADVLSRMATVDPGHAYGVVYMWGTSGLGFNAAKLSAVLGKDTPLDSWSLIFDPAIAAKIAQCGIYVLDSQSDAFETALNYLGLDPHSLNPADYERAAALWRKARPNIAKFHSSEYISALANGDICLAMGYSGDIFQARDRAKDAHNGVDISYVIPKEGSEMWADFMAIPKDAPHPEAAHAFLNYILDPKVVAAVTNTVYYANANTRAAPYIDPRILGDKSVYPDKQTMAHLFSEIMAPADIERLATRTWTRIKTGG